MTDKLTWDEIKKHYPDEWVVLVDGAFSDNDDPTEGVVYDHGADRTQVYARCRQAPSPITVLYTGEIRGGLVGFYTEDVDQKG